jgi:hypothetical protein
MAGEPSRTPITVRGLEWRGQRLRLDVAAAEVFGCFDRICVGALLLKGRSISSWLYEESDARPQLDLDLLIAPSDLVRAEEILASLGYRRTWDDRRMPTWWREHAGEWLRESDGAVLDVHHTLAGVGVDSETAWCALSRDPAAIIVAGREVPVLGLPARALHIAMHAAHHGVGAQQPLEDLTRALRAADSGVWQAAAQLARELDAIDAFTAGLQVDPDGAALARSLGLPSHVSGEAALRASSSPSAALGFEQLARARGMRAKVAIVGRKVVPPAEFVRYWDPRARRSVAMLIWAYLRRPLWLLSRAPRGFWAWYRARAQVRR